MAHLKKLPTYFVKGDERRPAYYSRQARELLKAGFVEEGEKAVVAPVSKPVPEVAVDVLGDAFDMEAKVDPAPPELEDMTKAELLEYAEERDLDVSPSMLKSEIFEKCRDYEYGF